MSLAKLKGGKRREKLDDFFVNWANRTTLHGLNEFASSKTFWIRCLWGLVLIVALCLMVLQIYRLANKFVSRK